MKTARDRATGTASSSKPELVLRDLAVQRWPIDKLIPYARNARTHSDEQVAQVAASIVEFGWTNPILVGADGVIIAGHARLAAARKLKLLAQGAAYLSGFSVRCPTLRTGDRISPDPVHEEQKFADISPHGRW